MERAQSRSRNGGISMINCVTAVHWSKETRKGGVGKIELTIILMPIDS